MAVAEAGERTAVLASGGIDSSVLIAELLERRARVVPIYVRGGLRWEQAELEHLRRFLAAIARTGLEPLQLLDQPVGDVYGKHWSTGGARVPAGDSPDAAVFLPGRNLFLITKTAVWCALHQVPSLALAVLRSNPFPDSTPEFFASLERLIERSLGTRVRLLRPLGTLDKVEVVRRGGGLPLALTWSCINPVGERSCGACNKCAERRAGFRSAGLHDPTPYVHGP
jgi:7-cyano-7-deazaguanine synthase